MHPSTLERVLIDGPVGDIELDINDPGATRRGIALIAHPNPVHGGTKDNKVVNDVVPLAAVLDWARPQHLPVVVVPGAEHFFHGQLTTLSQLVLAYCRY